ncbi:unnamed protein product [Lepeophtheirus salmonis]|uniref:(salmon louse) hypothetical protein n=1 Tax=Lepeophtheirus salmonis TaxID=72036 RepID=A0A7R8CIY7_LEPSM|nr:unnamed protein product [Lepeophtheirus salmonis]CAF2782385.1 unnamed protein product [Lepeophtheirus salmonis]
MSQTQALILIIILSLQIRMSTLSAEFASQLRIVSPLSSKPLDLIDGQEIVYSRRRTFHLLASSPTSDWSVSRDEGGSPTCRYEVNRPTDGNWTNSLFVFNETSGDFDVKSVSLRALVKSRLSTNKKRIKLRLDQSTEVQCTSERGYPAPKISWKYGYTLLVPHTPIVNCDDFSCSTESRLNFTGRRDMEGIMDSFKLLKKLGTQEISVTVLPAPKGVLKSGLFITCLFFGVLIFLFLIFLLLYCLFIFFQRHRRQKKDNTSSPPLEVIYEEAVKPFTIYNPPSVTSSSAYFSSGSDDVVFLSSSDGGEMLTQKLKGLSDSELCNDDELFEYEWEGWGTASHSSSLSDIISNSSTQNDSDPEDLDYNHVDNNTTPDFCRLGPQLQDLAQIYDNDKPARPSILYEVPNESWV